MHAIHRAAGRGSASRAGTQRFFHTASCVLCLYLLAGNSAWGQDLPPAEAPPVEAAAAELSPAVAPEGAVVVAPPAEAVPAAAPESLHEQIDRWIEQGWLSRGVAGADPATDEEFIRRVYLDLTGMVPTAAGVREFLANPDPDKRTKLIDGLLASPEFNRQLQRALDVMLMERRPDKYVTAPEWQQYLRDSIAANKSWAQLAREILLSDGTDPAARPAAKFVLDREVQPHVLARDVGRLFLGRDLQCAQCHDHPLVSDYLQQDYYGLFAFFNRSSMFTVKETNVVVVADSAAGDVTFKSVFIKDDPDHAMTPHLPGEAPDVEPTFEAGQEYDVAPADGVRPIPKYSRRAQLAQRLPAPGVRAFARNYANRMWYLLLGRGLVHPLDMDHSDNPPSYPELLDALTDFALASNFDIRAMLREIALSRTYQRGSLLPDGQPAADPAAYQTALLRALSPEQYAWSLMQATGQTDLQRVAQGANLTEATLHDALAGNVATFVQLYGGQPGTAESGFQATLEQTLFLANGDLLRAWLSPAGGALVDRVQQQPTPELLAEELFLSVYARRPTSEETAEIAAYLQDRTADRVAAIQEIAWAMLASAEFRFNH